MAIAVGDYISSLTGGQWKSSTSVASSSGPDAYASTINASNITFTLTRVPVDISTVKIGYRLLKYRNASNLSYSSSISSPAIGSTVTISSLTEGETYQIIPMGYDADGCCSEPGGVFNVIPSSGYEHARDIADAIKTILESSMNNEVDNIETREGVTLDAIQTFTSTVVGVEFNFPTVAVIPMDTPLVDKIGNRKIWQYNMRVEIATHDRGGDSQDLEKNIEYYMEAAETVLDQNDTAGETVWEVEVIDKQYPDVTIGNMGEVFQRGILILRVDQTNQAN